MPADSDALRAEYDHVCANFRTLTDIRFKLLAFLPIGTAAAAALGSGAPSPLLSAFGLVVTLALLTYNERNNQLYNELVGRAATLERKLGLADGSFANRPAAWWQLKPIRWNVNHSFSINLVYQASLGVWLFGLLSWFTSWLHQLGGPLPGVPPFWRPALALVISVSIVVLGTVLVSKSKKLREANLRSRARKAGELAKTAGLEVLKAEKAPEREEFIDLCSKLAEIKSEKAEARLNYYTGLDTSSARIYFPDHPDDEFAAHIVSLVTDLPVGWIYDCMHNRRGSL